MKRRKRKTKLKFKVIYEYIPSPDAEERLNRAYDMLFDKIDPFDYFDFAQYRFAQGQYLSETEVLRNFRRVNNL